MSLMLPSEPTQEELARDWLLSEQDLVEVRRCRSDETRHSFAINRSDRGRVWTVDPDCGPRSRFANC